MFHWGEFEQPIKSAMDITAIGALIGSIAQWLPSVAALLTVVWGALRIYDAYLDIQAKRAKLAIAREALGTIQEQKENPDAH